MDCIISSHSIRTFCSSISALSKIGKDLYLEFDAVDGLVLRTLNDSKSAFCEFAYGASYFERCSSDPTTTSINRKRSVSSPDERYTCRIPLRAMGAVVRPRKGLLSLRIRNQVSADQLYLSFEFLLQQNGNQIKIVHRIAVADSESVAAVAPKEGCSQVVALPRVLTRMLEPLKRTYEVALIINEPQKLITASSFHHGSGSALAQTQADKQMKTETSIGLEELEDYDWISGRDSDGDMPPNVNTEVALIIGLKDIKSMLHFCSQGGDDSALTTISFHWGGKPMIVETKGPGFTAQLVLATLDHSLLGGLTSTTNTNTNRE